jgi:hypothetical protein
VVLVGVLSAGVLLILVFAYLCSAFLLNQFGIRRRILVGASGLPAVLGLNLLNLILTAAFGAALAYMSGRDLYLYALIVAVVAQAVLLVQHLRFYHRDHLRVSYEN